LKKYIRKEAVKDDILDALMDAVIPSKEKLGLSAFTSLLAYQACWFKTTHGKNSYSLLATTTLIPRHSETIVG